MAPKIPEFGRFAEPSLLILASLSDGPKHGYAMMTDIEAETGRPMGPGTLYAAIARLEDSGLVEAMAPVDRRRPYRLTGLGASTLAEQLRGIAAFAQTGLRRMGTSAMTHLLLRLYPASWRARYGDEFAAILEERPLGPFDVTDVVLGAIDARLHPRVARQAAPERGFSMSLRIAGAAALIGGVLWPLGFFIANLGDAWIGIGAAIHVAGSGVLLVALIGLSAFQARRHPRLVWAAFLLPAAGAAATIVGMTAMAALGDRPLAAGVSGWYIWMVGLLATLAGSAIFGAVSYRVRSVSRSAAAILTIGPILAFFSLLVVSSGLVNGPVALMVAAAGLIVFAAGWAAMGIRALRLARPAVSPRAA